MSIIHAIFEDGVFRPIERVDLPERCRVEFEPRVVGNGQHDAGGMRGCTRSTPRWRSASTPVSPMSRSATMSISRDDGVPGHRGSAGVVGSQRPMARSRRDSLSQAYQRDQANRASIVDHISFQVMRRMGILDAFTNDHHFAAAGFRPLF